MCSRAQLTAHEVHALPSIGLTLDGYALYFVVLSAVFSAVFVAVATLLIWHRSAERIALFASFSLVLLGVIVLPDSSVPFHLTREHPAWQAPLDGLTLLAICCALLFFYSFPDGRFVPRWTGVLVVAWAAVLVPTGLFPNAPVGVGHLPLAVRDLLQLGVLGPIPFVQVYRYRRTADAVQRQQTKWVDFGIASAVLVFLGLVASGVLLSPAEWLSRSFPSPPSADLPARSGGRADSGTARSGGGVHPGRPTAAGRCRTAGGGGRSCRAGDGRASGW